MPVVGGNLDLPLTEQLKSIGLCSSLGDIGLPSHLVSLEKGDPHVLQVPSYQTRIPQPDHSHSNPNTVDDSWKWKSPDALRKRDLMTESLEASQLQLPRGGGGGGVS